MTDAAGAARAAILNRQRVPIVPEPAAVNHGRSPHAQFHTRLAPANKSG